MQHWHIFPYHKPGKRFEQHIQGPGYDAKDPRGPALWSPPTYILVITYCIHFREIDFNYIQEMANISRLYLNLQHPSMQTRDTF